MEKPNQNRSGSIKRGKLFFTIKLPQSGGSTFCNWFVQNRPNCVVIGGDDFRNALYGREFQIEAEGTVFSTMDVAIRALLNRGFDVIIDETSTTEATLFRYYKIDENAKEIWINTTKEECIKRAIENNRRYLVLPIKRMAKQFDFLKKNFKKIKSKIIDYLNERKIADVPV